MSIEDVTGRRKAGANGKGKDAAAHFFASRSQTPCPSTPTSHIPLRLIKQRRISQQASHSGSQVSYSPSTAYKCIMVECYRSGEAGVLPLQLIALCPCWSLHLRGIRRMHDRMLRSWPPPGAGDYKYLPFLLLTLLPLLLLLLLCQCALLRHGFLLRRG